MFKSSTASDKKLSIRGIGAVSDSEAPPTVQWAVRFMLFGAAISTIYLIFAVIVTSGVKSALVKWNAGLPKSQQHTAQQISNAATDYIVSTIIIGLIAIGLWLWMARMNGGRRTWARITASVFFALWTYYTYSSIGQLHGGSATFVAALVITFAIWLVGLAALYFLWRPESSSYYKSAP